MRGKRGKTNVARRPYRRAAAALRCAARVRARVARRARGRAARAVGRVEDDAGLENAKGRRVLKEGIPVLVVRRRAGVLA